MKSESHLHNQSGQKDEDMCMPMLYKCFTGTYLTPVFEFYSHMVESYPLKDARTEAAG